MSSEIVPKLRSGAAFAVTQAIGQVVEAQVHLRGLHQSCLSCVTFREESEWCVKYNARPPARVIAYGCPGYFDEEEIPF